MSAFFVIEIIGTVAFAISGAMTGIRKDLDLFGVMILALTTATGGGMIRDALIGATPAIALVNPIYALVAFGSTFVVMIPAVRRFFWHRQRLYDLSLLIMDTVGLGVFCVTGVGRAIELLNTENLFLLVFVGTLTGVGGSILRDVMTRQKPFIFVKHFYACAAAAGSLVCALMWNYTGKTAAMTAGAVVVMLLRFLAAYFHWNLPHIRDDGWAKEEDTE